MADVSNTPTTPIDAKTGPPPLPTADGRVVGAFQIDDRPDEEFDLHPAPNHPHPLPTDQVKLSREIYETKNVLKLLQENKRFGAQRRAYHELLSRVKEVANAGLI